MGQNGHPWLRADTVARMATAARVPLPDSMIASACRDLTQILDEERRQELLGRLSPYLPENAFPIALQRRSVPECQDHSCCHVLFSSPSQCRAGESSR
jgi:hypothetical protein